MEQDAVSAAKEITTVVAAAPIRGDILRRNVRLSQKAADDGILELLEIAPGELVEGVKFARSLSPILARAYRIAAELNHVSLCAEHFVLALVLEKKSRPVLEQAGYNVEAARLASTERLKELKGATGQIDLLDNPPEWSPWLQQWKDAARKLAGMRDPENHTIGLGDFLAAISRAEALLSANFRLALRNLLPKGVYVPSVPMAHLVTNGFNKIEQELGRVEGELQDVERRRAQDRRVWRARLWRMSKDSKGRHAAVRADTKALREEMSRVRALLHRERTKGEIALMFVLFGSVAAGAAIGLVARLQFGIL